MPPSVLSQLCLGYQPLWNRQRLLGGVRLFVHPDPAAPLDTGHLLRTLEETWTPHAPPVLLACADAQTLCALMAQASNDLLPWIEVDGELLHHDAVLQASVFTARERGLPLIWRGRSDQLPEPDLAACFERCLLSLSREDAAQALRLREQWLSLDMGEAEMLGAYSPVLPAQLLENPPSRALVQHALDQRFAYAVAGWPNADVLQNWRQRAMHPQSELVGTVCRIIDADESMEVVEQELSKDPVLVYRLLCHANSAALGVQSGITSLRRALMIVGYTRLRQWLQQQVLSSPDDIDLLPIKAAMVLRAKVMEHLLDAGDDEELRREIYLCGLFSQMDDLLGVSLGTCVQTLPLSDRIFQATVQNTGPYEPALALARALEHPHGAATVLALCADHGMELEDVNRKLLRTLAAQYVSPPVGTEIERRRRGRGRKLK